MEERDQPAMHTRRKNNSNCDATQTPPKRTPR